MLKAVSTVSVKKSVSFIAATLLLVTSAMSVASEAESIAPSTYSGAAVVKADDNHYQVRVTSLVAVKMRCVAYNDAAPIAINSIAIYPPEGIADFYIDPKEGPVTHATCWVTSTREGDREKINQLEKEAQKREMKIKESNIPFYKVAPTQDK